MYFYENQLKKRRELSYDNEGTAAVRHGQMD